MNVEKLMKLANFLRRLEDDRFDFTEVISESSMGCGTVCCAIGWLPTVFPDEVRWEDDWLSAQLFVVDSDDEDRFSFIASKLFDCCRFEMSFLFSPHYQNNIDGWGDFPVCVEESTPNDVADAIEHYIKIRS